MELINKYFVFNKLLQFIFSIFFILTVRKIKNYCMHCLFVCEKKKNKDRNGIILSELSQFYEDGLILISPSEK